MAKPPIDFMEKYGVLSTEVWEVRGGVWAIKHSALERVAAEQKVVFDRPAVLEINTANKIAVVCVFGSMGERTEWSIGEASPHNNKNAYPAAMAEKRAKDRVTLKLLNSHGAIYSDAEADDFVQTAAPTLAKKDAKEVYVKMQREARECATREQLKEWMKTNADRIHILPDDWQDTLRLQCEELLLDLRQREPA